METEREPPITVFLFSESYFQAAEHLRLEYEMQRSEPRFDAPIYYLFCHALELTMEAFYEPKA